jgi:hypothetical protein
MCGERQTFQGSQVPGRTGSRAKVAAQMGPVVGKGACEQALARRLFGQLEPDWLLIADRGFYNWPDWQAAAAIGRQPVSGSAMASITPKRWRRS